VRKGGATPAPSLLFDDLPVFPAALPDDELRLLADLEGCEWPAQQEIDESRHGPARRLEDTGLVRISCQKDDPVATRPTWYAGRPPAASIRNATPSPRDGDREADPHRG
jgi:hypothetical protein